MQTRIEIIRRIREVKAALESLGASRENIVLGQFTDIELLEILKSLDAQLKRRREFLGKKL